MVKTLCIRHLRRPEIYISKKEVGNCKICKPGNENKNCSDYYPIKLVVEEKEE